MTGSVLDNVIEIVKTGGILGIAYAAGQLVRSVRELERRVASLERTLEERGQRRG